MTDWPEAVREYERAPILYTGGTSIPCKSIGVTDAAIAALKEAVEPLREKLRVSNAAWIAEKKRREQAESEVAEADRRQAAHLDTIRRLGAENERLRQAHNACINYGEMMGMKVVALARDAEAANLEHEQTIIKLEAEVERLTNEVEKWQDAATYNGNEAQRLEADKVLCQEAAQKSNDAAYIANADNNRLRAEVERLRWMLGEALRSGFADGWGCVKSESEMLALLAARYEKEHNG